MKNEINVLYDTSALIELLLKSKSGEKVGEAFMADNVQNYVPSIVLAELTSKLSREGVNHAKFVKVIEENSTVLPLTSEVAKDAGRVHSKLKPKEDRISLIDCVIMAHGKSRNAQIMSKDKHFKHYKNAEILA
jgi:predicted nucleic acid-binding protein